MMMRYETALEVTFVAMLWRYSAWDSIAAICC